MQVTLKRNRTIRLARPHSHLFSAIYIIGSDSLPSSRRSSLWHTYTDSLALYPRCSPVALCASAYGFLSVPPLLPFSSCRALLQSLRAVRAVRSCTGAVHSLPFTYGCGSSRRFGCQIYLSPYHLANRAARCVVRPAVRSGRSRPSLCAFQQFTRNRIRIRASGQARPD